MSSAIKATSSLGGEGLLVVIEAEDEQSVLIPENFIGFEIFLLTAKDLMNIDSR